MRYGNLIIFVFVWFQYLHAEQAARIAHEQAMREENEKRWSALQKLTEEEVLHVREGQKVRFITQMSGYLLLKWVAIRYSN